MKKLLPIIFVCFIFKIAAQPGMYRRLPQLTSTLSLMMPSDEIKSFIKTQDGGYIFSRMVYTWGFESPGGLAYFYTIKTDSNFVPQWKKPSSAAIALPTGGIILLNNSTIEKVTANGTQVWIKNINMSEPIFLSDGVCYSNKLRLVGKKIGTITIPLSFQWIPTSQAYTLLMDTTGNLISESLFNSSVVSSVSILPTIPANNFTYTGSADFSRVTRDGQGNFFVYTTSNADLGPYSSMTIAKFDSSFTFVWGKTWGSNQSLFLSSIDILPNGRIFATGNSRTAYIFTGTLLKLDASGNIISQTSFANKNGIGGLCKKSNGNYVSTIVHQDSLFMFEVDTSLNISWNKFCGRGSTAGASVIKNNSLFTPKIEGSDPVLISNDLNGNSCSSYPITYSQLTSSISLINFTLSPVTFTAALSSGTMNIIGPQNYIDSCNCPVFIPMSQNNVCVGNTASISILGSGDLSWYATASGSSFIQSGPQFVFSSNTPTTLTVYAQDSACTANPNRTAINIVVNAVPSLTFSPLNPTICSGSQIFVYALGASNYTWSSYTNNSYVQNLNPATTTIYTVTGSVAQGCSDTKTMSVYVAPPPSLTLSPPSTICVGSTATLNATGALTYTWYWPGSVSPNTPSLSLTPTIPGQYVYTVYGSSAFCYSSMQTTVTVNANPILSVTATQSTLCSGKSSTLIAAGANTYTWNTLSNNTNIIVTPSVTTTYTLIGKSSNNCVSSQTISLIVFPEPTLSAGPSAYSVCEGAQVTLSVSGANSYTWNNGISTNSFTVSAPLGNNIYTLTGVNGICSKTISTHVFAFPNPTISFVSSPTVFCEGKPTTINAFGATTFSWNISATTSSILVAPTSNTNYIVYGANGTCLKSDTINLTVYSNPTLMLSISNTDICAGENVSLLATGAQSYIWNTGSNVNFIYQAPLSNTNYVVTGTNIQGCTDTKTIAITVHPLPITTLNSSHPTICTGESATLTANGASTYTWNSGTGASIVVSPTVNTKYYVTATDMYGCAGTDSLFQYVDLCTNIKTFSQDNFVISVLPNPSLGVFTVNLYSINEKMFLEIYNTIGQLVHAQKITELNPIINLENQASGIYYLQILGQERALTLKLVKE